MGLRAYLLVTVCDDVEQDEFIDIVRELEGIQGVDFVDAVIGIADLVVMVEAPVTLQDIANKILSLKWCQDIQVLRIISVNDRHRVSRKELLSSMVRSGKEPE